MTPNSLLQRLTPWCAATFGICLLITACEESDDEEAGAYLGHYRIDAPRSQVLPTPVPAGNTPSNPPAGGSGGAGGSAGSGMSGDGGSAGNAGSAGSASVGEAGSAGAGDPGDEPCSAANAFEVLVQVKCGTANCHVGDAAFGNFGESEAAAEAFVGELPSVQSEDCGVMIDPDDAEESLILKK